MVFALDWVLHRRCLPGLPQRLLVAQAYQISIRTESSPTFWPLPGVSDVFAQVVAANAGACDQDGAIAQRSAPEL